MLWDFSEVVASYNFVKIAEIPVFQDFVEPGVGEGADDAADFVGQGIFAHLGNHVVKGIVHVEKVVNDMLSAVQDSPHLP